MTILSVPAILLVRGNIMRKSRWDDCLDRYLELGIDDRAASELVVDGQAPPDGGKLHWNMTPSDIERVCEARALGAFR